MFLYTILVLLWLLLFITCGCVWLYGRHACHILFGHVKHSHFCLWSRRNLWRLNSVYIETHIDWLHLNIEACITWALCQLPALTSFLLFGLIIVIIKRRVESLGYRRSIDFIGVYSLRSVLVIQLLCAIHAACVSSVGVKGAAKLFRTEAWFFSLRAFTLV